MEPSHRAHRQTDTLGRGRQETLCPETGGETSFSPAFAGASCTEPVWSKKSFGMLGEGGPGGSLVMPGAVTAPSDTRTAKGSMSIAHCHLELLSCFWKLHRRCKHIQSCQSRTGLLGVVTRELSWLLLNISVHGASLSLVSEGPSSPSRGALAASTDRMLAVRSATCRQGGQADCGLGELSASIWIMNI